MNEKQKTDFSWMGLLFGAYYYAGYNKVGKAALMTVLGFMPLTMIFVNVYAGFKARKELNINGDFHWGKSIAVFVLQMVVTGVFLWAIESYKSPSVPAQEKFMSDVSGVWTPEYEDGLVSIDLLSETKTIDVVGNNSFEIIVVNYDAANEILTLHPKGVDSSSLWSLRKVTTDESGSFHLSLVLPDGSMNNFSFVRNLQ